MYDKVYVDKVIAFFHCKFEDKVYILEQNKLLILSTFLPFPPLRSR